LRALHDNVGIRLEPAQIVQGADAKSDEVGASPTCTCSGVLQLPQKTRTMLLRLSAFVTFRFANAKSRAVNASGRDVRATALALAVPAMTP
jgi:hypothetical protein